jgi:hypothetical protein
MKSTVIGRSNSLASLNSNISIIGLINGLSKTVLGEIKTVRNGITALMLITSENATTIINKIEQPN